MIYIIIYLLLGAVGYLLDCFFDGINKKQLKEYTWKYLMAWPVYALYHAGKYLNTAGDYRFNKGDDRRPDVLDS